MPHTPTGTLPPEWGAPGALPSLLNLLVLNNQLTGGQAPARSAGRHARADRWLARCRQAWLHSGPFRRALSRAAGQRAVAGCWQTRLCRAQHRPPPAAAALMPRATAACRPPTHPPPVHAGSIPDEWADPEAFPRLTLLGVSSNRLNGSLPSGLVLPSLLILCVRGWWGSRGAFGEREGGAAAGPRGRPVVPLRRCTAGSRACCTAAGQPASSTAGQPGLLPQIPCVRSAPCSARHSGGNQFLPHWPIAASDHGTNAGLPGSAQPAPHQTCVPCSFRRANDNQLTGPLPPEWGTNASLPSLRLVSLHRNQLSGELPAEWGAAGAAHNLEELYLQVGGRCPTREREKERACQPVLPRLRVASSTLLLPSGGWSPARLISLPAVPSPPLPNGP